MGRYAIIGAGAIGGYYGACLQRSGHDVHFLLHRDYEQVCQNGLLIESIRGDFTLPQVQGYRDVNQMPPVDSVIIALKTTQNHRLPELVTPLLGPNTIIITLQNGFGIEDEIGRWAGNRVILGGLCRICSNKIGPGHIRHLENGYILLGQYSPSGQPVGMTPQLEAVAADFNQADIAIELQADLRQARWRKLVWNIPFNGLSVILRATTQEMMADPDTRSLAIAIMHEVIAASHADLDRLTPGGNRGIPDTFIAATIAHTESLPAYHTSMKLDFDHGRPLEVEAIFGSPLKAAEQAGISLPRIETLYHQLKAIDRQRQRGPESSHSNLPESIGQA